MALYRFQVIDAAGNVVLPPFRPVKQRHGTVDIDLIETCVRTITARGVGIFRTQAHVEAAIREGIHEAIQELKADLVPVAGGRG
jgi:hypothetical protein